MEEARTALAVACNANGRWEWVLTFSDGVTLPSTRVSDQDYATREEALAAGDIARSQFAGRTE